MATRTRSMWLRIQVTLPRKKPSSSTPQAHRTPPIAVKPMKREPHLAHAGDQGDEGPDDGDEPGQDQGPVTVVVQELTSAGDVGGIQDSADHPGPWSKQRRPDQAAECIAAGVAEDGRDGEDQTDQPQRLIHRTDRDEQPHREQQRVSRQDREQPALGEDDHGHTPQGVGAEAVDELLRIHPGQAEGG